jgi:ribonuclease E
MSEENTTGEKKTDGEPFLVPKKPPPTPTKPQGGDAKTTEKSDGAPSGDGSGQRKKRRRRRGRGGGGGGQQGGQGGGQQGKGGGQGNGGGGQQGKRKSPSGPAPIEALLIDEDGPIDLDDETLKKRSGKRRKGRAVGRYQMNVHVDADTNTHIAVLEGRSLIEHYVARPADDIFQIHGNVYIGKVENVLPGMEAAFIDIGTPKNAVLYRGDVQFDPADVEEKGSQPRIEDVLKEKQLIVCQVTKNPIGHKGARLTQEVSLPGRFVVLVPNSKTFGISKRLPDPERKRLRQVLDKAKPKEHGIIVRTAAEDVTGEEIERDVSRLLRQWEQILELSKKHNRPAMLYREPNMAVRVIREEFNADYRAVIIDDESLFTEISEYIGAVNPALADRVQHYDLGDDPLPLFERFQITEQLRKGLDRKVWLPGGGSLIIEHTEALTVIDVNTGRNVGSKSLEETVFRNNLEAAEEVARQLRLRDIGGIIVIDFVDMEIKDNRAQLVRTFKDALSRDKTRTQVFSVSELGLVEMTRKRIGEGLLESFSDQCETCHGRGLVMSHAVLGTD